ncbi:MAG TPA: pantoate--beta-alanine ligase, partial [Chthoniobacteraceae bacterium]|nr:pantoate--beta-alanine ligase [Chthoniobacteraceae bacterium]
RNSYLTPEERAQAPVIRAALLAARASCRRGEKRAARLRAIALAKIAGAALARVDYVEVADADSLEALSRVNGSAVMAAAVFFGKTRLIDNILL